MDDFRQALRECGISVRKMADLMGWQQTRANAYLLQDHIVREFIANSPSADADNLRDYLTMNIRIGKPAGPILMRQILSDVKISQVQAALDADLYFSIFSRILLGKQTRCRWKLKIYAEKEGKIIDWLKKNELSTIDIFNSDSSQRIVIKKWRGCGDGPIVPGDPNEIKPREEEAQMINQQAKKHFKLFRDPFLNDINDLKDIYLSQDHMFLREMMLEGARHRGFVAVHGEVGCGKSVMRKAVVRQLQADNIKVIFPMILDKSRITSSSLLDAVIMDLTDEPPKRTLEAKSRQAVKLLKGRANNGQQQVLVLEEAQLLNLWAFKSLKQIYEFEDGYQKLMGIVLIGQPELAGRLDETQFPQLREVIRRITCAEVTGLGKEDVVNYLKHKFSRVGANVDTVIAEDAYDFMMKRMTGRDGRGNPVSKAYPLTINNLCVACMNSAAAMGEVKVNADVVINL